MFSERWCEGCLGNGVIIEGYVIISGLGIEGGKILGTIDFRENVFDFWHGLGKLLSDFVQGSLVDDKAFSTITLRYNDDQSWSVRMATNYDFGI